MNNTFDPGRFGRLWRAHWAESWREYLWFALMGAIINLIFLVLLFASEAKGTMSSFELNGQRVWYVFGLFISAFIFAGRHFRRLAEPGVALITLMRPASHLEKWLLAFLLVAICYPLAYTVVYCAMNYPVVELARQHFFSNKGCLECDHANVDFRIFVPFFSVSDSALSGQWLHIKQQVFSMLLLWSGQGLLLGGTLFFRRSPILRTLLALFVLGVGLVALGPTPTMGGFWSATGKEVVPFSALEMAVSLVLWAGLPLLLWLSALFHLKNRELA